MVLTEEADQEPALPPPGIPVSDPFIGAYAPGSFKIPTGKYAVMSSMLQLTGSQQVELAGTATLRIS